jgi:hypothetical protein
VIWISASSHSVDMNPRERQIMSVETIPARRGEGACLL